MSPFYTSQHLKYFFFQLKDFKQQQQQQHDTDLLDNFQNEPDIYKLLPSVPPSTATSNIQNHRPNNCFLESFTKKPDLKTDNFQFDEQTRQDDCLKRKRLNSGSNDAELLSPSETNCSTSSTSSANNLSPLNSFETNLTCIKEMLTNLTDSHLAASRRRLHTEPKDDSLRLLCESIKEKLETNSYQSIDELNNDINLIKDEYNQIDEYSSIKRLKFTSSYHVNNENFNNNL